MNGIDPPSPIVRAGLPNAAADAEALDDVVDCLDIIVFRPAAQCISQELFGQTGVEIAAARTGQDTLQLVDVAEALARDEFAAGVDGLVAFLVAVHAQSVEVLQPQAKQALHAIMNAATRAEAEAFLRAALAAGHEGVMAKDPASGYEPGGRGKRWFKVKAAETVDCVIVAVDRGSGRRAGWLSNYHLAVIDGEGFAEIGKTFKGFTDQQFVTMTERLWTLAVADDGLRVVGRQVLGHNHAECCLMIIAGHNHVALESQLAWNVLHLLVVNLLRRRALRRRDGRRAHDG